MNKILALLTKFFGLSSHESIYNGQQLTLTPEQQADLVRLSADPDIETSLNQAISAPTSTQDQGQTQILSTVELAITAQLDELRVSNQQLSTERDTAIAQRDTALSQALPTPPISVNTQSNTTTFDATGIFPGQGLPTNTLISSSGFTRPWNVLTHTVLLSNRIFFSNSKLHTPTPSAHELEANCFQISQSTTYHLSSNQKFHNLQNYAYITHPQSCCSTRTMLFLLYT